ncbi:MAG TPA: hypothetical protein ENI52_05070 [Thermoplasmata archaeon]|nr:hypothetical protein [Thermoplasmata archaeon]
MMLGIKNKLKLIEKEVQKVEKLIASKGFYTASKNLLNKAANELSKDDISKALESIKRAEEIALKEKKLMEKINKYRNRKRKDSISNKLYQELIKNLEQGKIEEAEQIYLDFERAVINEEQILSKLKEIKFLINKKMAGSDPEEAEKFYKMSLQVLKEGRFDEANELAEKAKIAAKPLPEFLLQRARDYCSDALKNYEIENFEKAIELWKKSIEEYEKAKEIAAEKKDKNMIKNIEENIAKINKYIEEAEITVDNREMITLVKNADKKIEEAEKLIEENKHDYAIQLLKDAIKDDKEAEKLAKKRNFEDLNRIERRIEDVQRRIEYYQLEKGRYLIEKAFAIIDKNPKKSEKELYNVLNYLYSLQFETETYKQLKNSCKKAIITSKLKQAKNNMKIAEELYKNDKFYDARDIYQKIDDYLMKVEEEAGKFGVTSEIDDIRKLRRVCNENIDSCNSQLFNLPDAPTRKLIKVTDYKKFIPNAVPSLTFGDKNKLKKLSHEYEILDYLGGGGFADVYKAKWKKRDMVVALKIPRELTSSAEEIFFNEIRKWEKLNHRNIVNLLKPRIAPVPHLVIEYVDGATLHEILEGGKIATDKACRIAFDIARGLEYAHSKLIIHCDLKPKNVLVSKVGEAKITDFGIAKTVVTTSKEGIRGITLIYASPEQLDEEADEQTDVYQLGLLFYQMLTGINPFDVGNREEIERKIREEMPEQPSKYNKDAKPFDDIIMQCLAKNRDERPTLRQLREAIYEYMKKYHGESLHLTEDNKKYIELAITNAFYAAKQGDLIECISNLNYAKEKITKTKLKKIIDNLIDQLEVIQNEGVKLSEKTVEKIGKLLKQIL